MTFKYPEIEVFAVNTEKPNKIRTRDFFRSVGVTTLNTYYDPELSLVKTFKLRGLPTSILIDKDGIGINFEIAKERYKTDNIEKIRNENSLIHKKGIEVGHIFKLGDKYSKSMNLSIADSENNNHYLQMGCYGIGVSRIIAAVIEQNYDTNGIIWPKSISPFDVVIIEIDGDKNEEVRKYSESIYEMLINRDIDVILDDRNAKLGN